jgi:hypothetical protein
MYGQARALSYGTLRLTCSTQRCYRRDVLVEVRKQTVAGPAFRGTSEARAKGAANSSAEVAVGSPAEAVGGHGQYRPTVIRGIGWSAIEERGAFFLRAELLRLRVIPSRVLVVW